MATEHNLFSGSREYKYLYRFTLQISQVRLASYPGFHTLRLWKAWAPYALAQVRVDTN